MIQYQANISIFYRHLKLLLRTYQFFGLTHVNYNKSTRKFEHSKVRKRISRLILRVGRFVSGFYLLLLTLLVGRRFLTDNQEAFIKENEVIIMLFGQYCRSVISTFFFTSKYLTEKNLFIPTLNEVLNIYHTLRVITNGDILLPYYYQLLITIKMCLLMTRVLTDTLPRCWVSLCLGDISSPIGAMLLELTHFSHFFSQIILVCFYLKMNEFLASFSGVMSKREISERILGLASISFRIHRLKYTLNKFYSIVYFCTYLGLFYDINGVYKLLRNLLYLRLYPQILAQPMELFRRVLVGCMGAFSASFDIYLIGCVGEMLTTAESVFRNKLLLVYNKHKVLRRVKQIHRHIDLLLVQDSIQGLSTKAFGLFVINNGFAFYYVTDVIVAYAIVCVEFYATDTLYKAPGNRTLWIHN